MASIEEYQEQINTLKSRIEALKYGSLTIAREDGTEYEVNRSWDLDFKWGAVIADSEGEIYLRTAGTDQEYWRAATNKPYCLTLEGMYNHMREAAIGGVEFRFLNETEQR